MSFTDHDCEVISLLRTMCKFAYRGVDGVDEFPRRPLAVFAENLEQSFPAEFFPVGPRGLEHAVGYENDGVLIADNETVFCALPLIGKEPKWQTDRIHLESDCTGSVDNETAGVP